MQKLHLSNLKSPFIFGVLGAMALCLFQFWSSVNGYNRPMIPVFSIFFFSLAGSVISYMLGQKQGTNFAGRFAASLFTYMVMVSITMYFLANFALEESSLSEMSLYDGFFIGGNILLWGVVSSFFASVILGLCKRIFFKS